MKIGFDASRAFTKNRTGTENYSYQILSNLAKIDHKNEYIVYLRPNSQPTNIKWPSNFKFQTIDYPRLWTQVGLAKQTFVDKSLDVLFIPSHTLPLIHRPGLKTVVTVHDLGAEFLPQTHQLKQKVYLKFMTNYQLKNASHIIAVSEATKKDLIQKVGIDKDKITVVYEGYNEKLFKTYQKHKEVGQYFLSIGTIQPRKNLERLIRAFQKFLLKTCDAEEGSLRRARTSDNAEDGRREESSVGSFRGAAGPVLILVGSKGWLSKEIYKLPKELGIEDKVKFLGYVPDEELPTLYSGAIALLYPSLFEGFGLPILEAQACGCPVLTSNVSSMPEVAGKGAILVDPYSTDSIYKGMQQIYQKNIQEKLIKLGFENVKRFSWKKAAQGTLKVLLSTSD